jgi:hypothetical protein
MKSSFDFESSGIYEIAFKIGSRNYFYIGQSSNIHKRFQAHISDLKRGKHHNSALQRGWDEDSSCFKFTIVYEAHQHLTALDRQITLFRKEVELITVRGTEAANILDGNLVLTEEAKSEIITLSSNALRVMTAIRRGLQRNKEQLGAIILDLGILQRIYFKSTNVSVSEKNVLSWINKAPRSPLDYMPKINRNSPHFGPLYHALSNIQSQIEKLGRERKFIDDFIQNTTLRIKKYDVCSPKDLKLFLDIIEKYKQTPLRVNNSPREIKIDGKITVNQELQVFFDESALRLLSGK